VNSKEENSLSGFRPRIWPPRKRWVDHGGKHEKHRLTLTRSGEPLSRTRGTLTLPEASSLHLSKAYCLYLACGCLLTHFIVPSAIHGPPVHATVHMYERTCTVLTHGAHNTRPKGTLSSLWLYIKKICQGVSCTALKFPFTFSACTCTLYSLTLHKCKE
jgi:hypothetical protein